MCLTIDFEETENYRWENRDKKWVTVWKRVIAKSELRYLNKAYPDDYDYDLTKYYTPYQGASFTKKLTALDKVEISIYSGDVEVDGGAIHCYRSRKFARDEIDTEYESIIKCKAKMSNFLYCGKYGDICFKEIEVDQ